MTDTASKIDELISKPCWLIDIFPRTVPQTSDGRYFMVEEIFRKHRAELNGRFCRLLLKLYCYYDFWLADGEQFAENPRPDLLAERLRHCFADDRDRLNIILPDSGAMLVFAGGELYMSLYDPDRRLRELTAQLAAAEGLFFYRAP